MKESYLEKYAKIPLKTRRLVSFFFMLGLVGFYFFAFYAPKYQEIVLKKEKIEQLKIQLTEKKGYAKNLNLYQNQLDDKLTELERAKLLLPDSSDVAQFLAQVSERANDVHLEIKKFEPSSENKKEFYREIVFSTHIQGTYHQIAKFIDLLSHLERIVNVSDLNLYNPVIANNAVTLDAEFLIKTYRFVQNEEKNAEKEDSDQGAKQ